MRAFGREEENCFASPPLGKGQERETTEYTEYTEMAARLCVRCVDKGVGGRGEVGTQSLG